MMTFTVDLEPIGRRMDVDAGLTLLEAAQKAGVDLVAACGGVGICGTCKLRLVRGQLTPLTESEQEHLTPAEIADGYRLACQAQPLSDLRVDIPRESLPAAQQMQIDGREGEVHLEPSVWPFDLALDPPHIEDLRSDQARVQAALRQADLPPAVADLAVWSQVTHVLRGGDWHARLALRSMPGRVEIAGALPAGGALLGFAMDMGSTKLAAYLVDLRTGGTLASGGVMNPQIAYGEDVVSRIAYANRGEEQRLALQSRLVEFRQRPAGRAVPESRGSPRAGGGRGGGGQYRHAPLLLRAAGDAIGRRALRGLGQPAAGYPRAMRSVCAWRPARACICPPTSPATWAATTPRRCSPPRPTPWITAWCWWISAPTPRSACCTAARSTPAPPPAARPSRARTSRTACAPRRARLKPCTFARTAGFPWVPSGAWRRWAFADPAFCRASPRWPTTGIIDPRGVLDRAHPRVRSDRHKRAEFLLVPAAQTGHGRDIVITRRDVNEIQLAKGAIRAGIEVLLGKAGINAAQVDDWIIAGAFGTYLDLGSALRVGMFPNPDRADMSSALKNFHQVGNAAGVGARQMLLSCRQRERASQIIERVHYVELTIEPAFEPAFVDAMYFE